MEKFDLKISSHGEARTRVSEDNIALRYGSGSVDVFATPAMIALMEEAAVKAVDNKLPDGYATVGTELSVKHLAPTPIGINITVSAELVEVDGRKLTFKVEAFDELEKIGEGSHNRYIVELEKFNNKAGEKLKSN
jgi:predicted thioesterase